MNHIVRCNIVNEINHKILVNKSKKKKKKRKIDVLVIDI